MKQLHGWALGLAAACVGAAIVAGVTPALGHGDLDRRIEAMTTRIAESPHADLYARRGELHRRNGAMDAALADIETARRLDTANDAYDLARAGILQEGGWSRAALAVIDAYLAARPTHGPATLIRARAFFDLGEFEKAVTAFDAALAMLPRREPDHYLERARAAAATGDPGRALAGLDDGMRELGAERGFPITSLLRPAIDLEIELGRFDAALARLEPMLVRAQRKEQWLAHHGEILIRAGRPEAALESYRGALDAIGILPPRFRHTGSVMQLEIDVCATIDALLAGAGPIPVAPPAPDHPAAATEEALEE